MRKKIKIPKFNMEFDIEISDIQDAVPSTPPAPITPPQERRLFDLDSFWNKKISGVPGAKSESVVKELTRQSILNGGPWINIKSYSTPIYAVDDKTPKVPVYVVSKSSNAALPYTNLYSALQQGFRVPGDLVPASGTDGSCVIWDKSQDTILEAWQMRYELNQWRISWGAILEDVSNHTGIIPITKNLSGGDEKQGSRATGLALAGGVITLKELESGIIPHALALAVPEGQNKWVWPANRTDENVKFFPNGIVAGQRFFFSQYISINQAWCPMIQMMVKAVRDYGLVICDRAGSVSFHAEDPTQYGKGENAYRPYWGGKEWIWEWIGQFPFNQLLALA